jgi:glutamine synthetase
MKDILDVNKARFITVAMTDTNGLPRGQKISRNSFDGILKAGMGMAPVTFALDQTDAFLEIPGVTDENADFHDSPLIVDPETVRSVPLEKDGDDLLVLSNYTGETADTRPGSLLKRVLNKGADNGLNLKYGLELEYTMFNETAQTSQEKGFRNLTPATAHPSHDLLIYQSAQSEWYSDVADMCDAIAALRASHFAREWLGDTFVDAF